MLHNRKILKLPSKMLNFSTYLFFNKKKNLVIVTNHRNNSNSNRNIFMKLIGCDIFLRKKEVYWKKTKQTNQTEQKMFGSKMATAINNNKKKFNNSNSNKISFIISENKSPVAASRFFRFKLFFVQKQLAGHFDDD